ncbi:MAG: hypothetical protein RL062_822 [Bacteroidota bacterium]|jgi:hypothetical protein
MSEMTMTALVLGIISANSFLALGRMRDLILME